ncbi:MAG: SGNH/GDSL hydrolase family protein [Saccharofermentanales bacterium]
MRKNNLDVDYRLRNDFELISWWWTNSNDISDERLIFISDSDYCNAAKHDNMNISESGCIPVSWLRCGARIDIPAVVEVVKMNVSDYRYRYVIVSLKNILGDNYFNDLLTSVFKTIREYLPDTVLIWAAIEDSEADVKNILLNENGFYIDIRSKSPDESLKDISTFISEYEKSGNLAGHRASSKSGSVVNTVSDDFIINNRESIVWAHIGFNDARCETDKKRILLIGDSISCYGDKVIQKLSGRYTIDFLRTSKGVTDPGIYNELFFMLSQYDYDLVHMNNGIHRYGSTVDEYASSLRKVFGFINSFSDKTINIFATTTTINAGGGERPIQEADPVETEDIARRNDAAIRMCAESGYLVDDLYDLDCKNRLEKIDIYHFTDKGYDILADQVIESIESAFSSQEIKGV